MWHVSVTELFYNSCVNMVLFNLYLECAFVQCICQKYTFFLMQKMQDSMLLVCVGHYMCIFQYWLRDDSKPLDPLCCLQSDRCLALVLIIMWFG
jgi:hypothetical protein